MTHHSHTTHDPSRVTAPTILVTGGTGTLGRKVVAQLTSAGHHIRVLSRGARPESCPAEAEWAVGDLRNGAGLDAALRDVGTIIHCASNSRHPRDDLDAARVLIDSARAIGHPHLIYISIVGVDRVPLDYYRVKLRVEELVETSGLPWTILRATQFHDLVCRFLRSLAKLPVMMIPSDIAFQSVDTDDVAARLIALALGKPAGRAPDFGGPQVQSMTDMARIWLEATGRNRKMWPVRLPGKVIRAYRAGAHLAPEHPDGRLTFADYLHRPPEARGPVNDQPLTPGA